MALTDYFARVTIEKDATLNLQKVYTTKKPPATGGQAAVQPAPPVPQPAAAVPPAPPAKKIAIEKVTLQGGTLVFSDRHIRPEFSATMYKLGGKISGLSSEQMKFADVDLRGNLRNQSPLSITGKINPLRGDLFVDMKVSFSDIELSPLTPYFGTYLGNTVDKGKLSLDLMYHIENKQLTSENRVFIDQFTFGETVESDKATKLPVRLAIALLKDSKGEIHLDLPVTGRTDDPKFSVWKVIGQILMNLLEKAATAPFKLLGALFGGSENFSSVSFSPGSAQLAGTELEKLAKLGKVLNDRPALNLEVSGFVDKERDPEGYRQESSPEEDEEREVPRSRQGEEEPPRPDGGGDGDRAGGIFPMAQGGLQEREVPETAQRHRFCQGPPRSRDEETHLRQHDGGQRRALPACPGTGRGGEELPRFNSQGATGAGIRKERQYFRGAEGGGNAGKQGGVRAGDQIRQVR